MVLPLQLYATPGVQTNPSGFVPHPRIPTPSSFDPYQSQRRGRGKWAAWAVPAAHAAQGTVPSRALPHTHETWEPHGQCWVGTVFVPDQAKAKKASPKLIALCACMLYLHLQHSAASILDPDPGRTPNSDGAVPGCGAHTRTWYPHHALSHCPQHPAMPWHRRQPQQLLFR